jgi:hypothetical protein
MNDAYLRYPHIHGAVADPALSARVGASGSDWVICGKYAPPGHLRGTLLGASYGITGCAWNH